MPEKLQLDGQTLRLRFCCASPLRPPPLSHTRSAAPAPAPVTQKVIKNIVPHLLPSPTLCGSHHHHHHHHHGSCLRGALLSVVAAWPGFGHPRLPQSYCLICLSVLPPLKLCWTGAGWSGSCRAWCLPCLAGPGRTTPCILCLWPQTAGLGTPGNASATACQSTFSAPPKPSRCIIYPPSLICMGHAARLAPSSAPSSTLEPLPAPTTASRHVAVVALNCCAACHRACHSRWPSPFDMYPGQPNSADSATINPAALSSSGELSSCLHHGKLGQRPQHRQHRQCRARLFNHDPRASSDRTQLAMVRAVLSALTVLSV